MVRPTNFCSTQDYLLAFTIFLLAVLALAFPFFGEVLSACRSPKEMVCGEAKSQRNHSWLREVFVAPARPSIRIIPGVAVLMKRRSYAGARKNRHGSERIAMPHQQQQVTTKGWLERKERIQPTVVTNRLLAPDKVSRSNQEETVAGRESLVAPAHKSSSLRFS